MGGTKTPRRHLIESRAYPVLTHRGATSLATSAPILGYDGHLTSLSQISACENILVESQVEKHSPKKMHRAR